MGLYATLLDAEVPCPRCGQPVLNDWQFYFGAVAELPTYRLGDSILWDGPARFGSRSMSLVYALAYSTSEPACVKCQIDTIVAEILIEDGIVRKIGSLHDDRHLQELGELQDRIAVAGGFCEKPAQPGIPPEDLFDDDRIPDVAAAHID